MDINSADYKLSKAKAQLLIEHPFYASLLCNMPFVERDDIKTMAVDGKHVYYNKEFVMGMTLAEVKFVEAHEVMHCVLEHISRKKGRDHRKWNQAGDYIINDMLVTDKVGDMPKGGLYNQSLVAAGKTTDGVYNLLPDNNDDGKGPGDGGDDSLDEVMDGDPSTEAEIDQTWKIRAVQAAQVAKMCGKLSVAAARFVDGLVDKKVPWEEVMQRFVSKRVKTDRSFSRPNRRFLAQGLYLPAMSGEALGRIAFAVDCSGSIGNRELSAFAGQMEYVKRNLRPSQIDVYYFDSEVSHEESYSPEDELDVLPHGGGGTAFSPVIDAINAKDELPEACIFLTDLYCNDFGNPPDYPVLWVSYGAQEAPWGEVVKMDL